MPENRLKDMLDKATGKYWTAEDGDTYLQVEMEDGSSVYISVNVMKHNKGKPLYSKPFYSSVSCSKGIAFSILMCFDFLAKIDGLIDSLDPVAYAVRRLDEINANGLEYLLDKAYENGTASVSSKDVLNDPIRFSNYTRSLAHQIIRYVAAKAIGG